MDETKPDGIAAPPPPLRVLILEDDVRDAKLAAKMLEGSGVRVQFEVTDSEEFFRANLEKSEYDVILADFNLRNWTALDALEILKRSGKDIPLIVVTGSLGDESAVECIKRGAADFVLKDRPVRLPASVQRALKDKRLRTEMKRAEEALIAEKHLLHTLADNLPDAIYFKDRESRFTRINKAQAKLFGLSDPAQAVGKTDFDFFAAEHAQKAYEDELEIIRTGQPLVGKEEKETWPDGHVTWVSTTKMPLRDAQGNITGTFGVSRDITARMQTELDLRRINRALHTLSNCNEILVRAQSESELLESVCQSLVDVGGYRMAWVGFAEQDEARTVRPVTHAGFEEGYLILNPITWGDDDHGQGPTSRAIRSGQPVINRNTQTNAMPAHWREEALKRGYASSIALPLRAGSRALGALSLYAAESDAFDEAEVKLLSELADDLGFGIDTIRVRAERKLAEESLRGSEERYRALFERNLAGVFRTTLDGRILDCNQAMARILGFDSPHKARDRSVLDFYLSEHDRANFLERLKVEGGLTNFEMRLRREGRQHRLALGNISLTTSTASGSQIIEGTLVDITERKLAEAENSRLAVIVNSSDDAIFSATREGLIVTWNAGAERMYGYAAEEITGKHFFILVPEEHRAELAGIEERLLRGDALAHIEQEDMRKDGSRLQVSLTLSPIKDAAGVVTGVSVIAHDITERKRAEVEPCARARRDWQWRQRIAPDRGHGNGTSKPTPPVGPIENIATLGGSPIDEIKTMALIFLELLHPEDRTQGRWQGFTRTLPRDRGYDLDCRVRWRVGRKR